MFNTFWFTSMQSEIPSGEQARVFSWDYLGSTAMLPVGQALSGPVAARLGLSTTLYCAAGVTFVLFSLALSSRSACDFSPPAMAPAG
jgi:hypothetical protein